MFEGIEEDDYLPFLYLIIAFLTVYLAYLFVKECYDFFCYTFLNRRYGENAPQAQEEGQHQEDVEEENHHLDKEYKALRREIMKKMD